MSRIRSVHPGLWTDERFVSVQPLARLLFMGIWNECDDQGVFEWSPLKLKMRLLPADNADASLLLDELEDAGAVLRYVVGGKTYGAVRNFTRYQRPKKPNAVHPISPQATAFAAGSSEVMENQSGTSGEIAPQMEEEGVGGDPPTPLKKGGSAGKHPLPADWVLPTVDELPPQAQSCAKQWTASSYAARGEEFISFWRSRGRMMKDWRLTWAGRVVDIHSQVMRDQKFGNAPNGGNGSTQRPMTADELRRGIKRAEDFDDPDRAAELKRQLAALTEHPPDPKVAHLVTAAAKSMSARH